MCTVCAMDEVLWCIALEIRVNWECLFSMQVCYYCLRSGDQQLMHPIRKQFADHPQANVHPSTALEVDDLSGIGSYGEAPLFCSASCAASAEVSDKQDLLSCDSLECCWIPLCSRVPPLSLQSPLLSCKVLSVAESQLLLPLESCDSRALSTS